MPTPQIKDEKTYQALRREGNSEEKSARIANAAAPGLPGMAMLMIPLGIPLSPWLGSLSASVQRAVPADGATEAFAWVFAVITVGMSVGSAGGGLIIQAASAQAAFLAAGGLGMAGAAAGALRLLLPRQRLPV